MQWLLPSQIEFVRGLFLCLHLFIHSLTFFSEVCVQGCVRPSWLVLTLSGNIFFYSPPVGACGYVCGDFEQTVLYLNDLVTTQIASALWRERRDRALNPQAFFWSSPCSLTLSRCCSSSLYFSYFQTPSVFHNIEFQNLMWFYYAAVESLPLPSSNFKK